MNNNFLNILDNIDDDLKSIIRFDKKTNSLILNSIFNVENKIKIQYSDKNKGYVVTTASTTSFLKNIDITLELDNCYISDGFETYYTANSLKMKFIFFNGSKKVSFFLCDKIFQSYSEEIYYSFVKKSLLNYSDMKYGEDPKWHANVFCSFHFKKTKQIKDVIDAYITYSPCYKPKKKLKYIKL